MTSRAARLCLLGLAAALPFSSAFSPLSASGRRTGTVSRSALFVEPDPDTLEDLVEASRRDKPGLDGDLRTKLIAETIAPWRTLRLFLYGSLGSGASIGGFVTLTAVLAALSGARTDVDLVASYKDLAIDFGFAFAFAAAFFYDSKGGSELNERVSEKIEKKVARRRASQSIQARESVLGKLRVEIRVSEDRATKEGTVDDIQVGAGQNFVVVAGPRAAVRDALLGAQLLKGPFFARGDVLIVPLVTTPEGGLERSESGFGKRKEEDQSYVARPMGPGWEDYVEAEMADAEVQANNEDVREKGIAIVLARNGEVVRRGVGSIPWRKTIEELQGALANNN